MLDRRTETVCVVGDTLPVEVMVYGGWIGVMRNMLLLGLSCLLSVSPPSFLGSDAAGFELRRFDAATSATAALTVMLGHPSYFFCLAWAY